MSPSAPTAYTVASIARGCLVDRAIVKDEHPDGPPDSRRTRSIGGRQRGTAQTNARCGSTVCRIDWVVRYGND